MTKRLNALKWVLLLFFLCSEIVNAQILRDTNSLSLVRECIDNIYNLQFKVAGEDCAKLKSAYPDHPVIYLLEGMITYWENYPLSPSSDLCSSFEISLRKCIELCGKKSNQKDDAEYLLANLSARGLLLLFYSDNNMSMDVIPLATSTYQYIRRSFDYTSSFTDFLFFTGLYNYTREAYPKAYPVYAPLAMLFPKGDMLKGLTEIQTAAKNSILFKAESFSFLSGISLSFEINYEQAYNYSKSLHELYPANMQYLALYLKSQLLAKHYDEAEMLMKSQGPDITNSYYQAQLTIFKGILQEKKYHNDILAEQYYIKGVRDISLFGHFGNEFAAFGYFGLSRISGRRGDNNYKEIYRKKAFELADFKKVDFD